MSNVPLRRFVIALTSVLFISAVFAAGIGLYVAALARWPLLLVWWPRLVAGVVAVVAVVVPIGAWWLWWRLPRRQVNRLRLTIRDPKARADVEDNFRKTIGQLLLAAAALVGAGLAYLQFTEQQRSSHDVLISNQVAKGFELLGNKDTEPMQRMGGIYALEGVMNNSEDYHQPVLEALSAFVRRGTETATVEGPPTDDIQAAITVIRRRKSGFKELRPLNLAKAHIPKADLIGADLIGADLSFAFLGSAALNGADLIGANLSGAHLNGADLSGAALDDANLIGADLNGADLSVAFLSRADLSRANLSDAALDNANLSDANLSDANLSRANLSYADLSDANLSDADLSDANLSDADLSRADLTKAENLTQEQLDRACGIGVKGLDKLSPPLTIKPCPHWW